MHHIRYFLAVSETLNLTKAAERCNVTQPALTRAIKALESELGGELLRRERGLSHLTALGQRVLPMLRECYDTALAAKMVAASIRVGETAPLSVAVSHTVLLEHFGSMLRELSRALPGLQLTLHRGSAKEVAENLRSGTAELAIAGPLDQTWSRLNTIALFEERFGLLVSTNHKLARRKEIEFKELLSETLLINDGCELADELRTCLDANNIINIATHHVRSQEDLLTLLKAGLGVAIMPTG
jgi:DNA-binding transcriptional LysR family regulator